MAPVGPVGPVGPSGPIGPVAPFSIQAVQELEFHCLIKTLLVLWLDEYNTCANQPEAS